MFAGATAFNADISRWDVSHVTDMSEMFYYTKSFNADISKWDVSRVTDMHEMFVGATSFNVDLSKWDVSRVTTMSRMFYYASSFRQTLCGEWVFSTADKSNMFVGSSGSIALHPDVCITQWSIAYAIVLAIAVLIACCIIHAVIRKRRRLRTRQQRRRFVNYGQTEAYQNEVRREWLRGLHALSSYRDRRRRIPPLPSAVRDNPDVSQLVDFFNTYPGLRRPVGGRMALYYSPYLSESVFQSRENKPTRVIPVQ